MRYNRYLQFDFPSAWPRSIIRDIHRGTPAAIRKDGDWLYPILDRLPNTCVKVLDRDLRYVMAGGPGLADIGLSRDLVIGNTMAQLYTPSAVDSVFAAYERALAGERGSWNIEYADFTYEFQVEPIAEPGERVPAILSIARRVEPARREAPEAYDLSPREREVLSYMTLGWADKEIAAVLGSRVYTVNKQVGSILAKLDARSRTEASVRAVREGLISTQEMELLQDAAGG